MLNSLPYFPHTTTVWFRINISNLTFSGDQSVELECFKIKTNNIMACPRKEILFTFSYIWEMCYLFATYVKIVTIKMFLLSSANHKKWFKIYINILYKYLWRSSVLRNLKPSLCNFIEMWTLPLVSFKVTSTRKLFFDVKLIFLFEEEICFIHGISRFSCFSEIHHRHCYIMEVTLMLISFES